MIHPLNALLGQGRKWNWTQECANVFRAAKQSLSSDSVLEHFNLQLPLRLAGDPSCYGIGAVLSHQYPDGSERPTAYASRTLLLSERNYTQIKRETLSLVFRIQKFHQFIYGRSFTLVTDHKTANHHIGWKEGDSCYCCSKNAKVGIFIVCVPL